MSRAGTARPNFGPSHPNYTPYKTLEAPNKGPRGFRTSVLLGSTTKSFHFKQMYLLQKYKSIYFNSKLLEGAGGAKGEGRGVRVGKGEGVGGQKGVEGGGLLSTT